jgi:gliding motility-associated-like protein
MNKILLGFSLVLIINVPIFAQGIDCPTSDPFCTGTTYDFPAGINQPSLGSISCCLTTPNPAWYYLQIANPGNLEITILGGNSSNDIDFVCWGPFSSLPAGCNGGLTGGAGGANHHASGPGGGYPIGNVVDCSYDPSPQEWCYIPNAQTGEIYVLLLTNFSNSPCNIVFSQDMGPGTTDCNIMAPPITGDTVCIGETIQLTVNNPTTGATYNWTGPNGFSSNVMNPTIPNATPAASGVYSMTITVGGQTSLPVTCNVLVNPNPTITISPPNPSTCAGSSVTLTPACTTGAAWYTWSDGSQGAGPITVTPAANTTYTVTGTDQNGCSGTASIDVIISPNLTITATATPATICVGQTSSLSAVGGTTYTWQPGALPGNPVNVTPSSTTTYTVSASDANSCTGSTTVTVTVNSTISVTASANPGTICISQSTDLTAVGGVNYSWQPGALPGNPITVTPVASTVYSVSASDANGCTGSATIVVTVNTDITVNAVANPSTICSGQNSVLAATGGLTYTWLPDGMAGSPVTVSPTADIIYTVNGDMNGCTGSTVVTVSVIEPINLVIAADIYRGCEDLLVQFLDISGDTTGNWYWEFGDNGFSYSQNPQHLYTTAGVYDVTLTVNSGPCVSTITWSGMISVYPVPHAYFTPNPSTISELNPLVFFDNQSIGASGWNWYFGDTNDLHNNSNAEFPNHTYTDTGTYIITLVAITDHGCKDTIRQSIYVAPNIAYYVPNAFTPNDDARNQNFFMKGEGIDWTTFDMIIYDRWGKLILHTTDHETGWDGKSSGHKAIPGVYSYIISFTDIKFKEHKLKGAVVLIK